MFQEFHILRCFSCETFQNHIVKKTNKWECKLCGVKQSVKKVYGRGSGKDCRIHTQKLNALRGQKEETGSLDQQIEEISEAELPERHLPTSDQPSPANPNNVFKRTSKWAEFVDENETVVNQNDFSKSEKINFTPIITCKSKRQKRKIRDEFDDKEIDGCSDDFNTVDGNYSMLSNTLSSGYTKEVKFNKCNTTKNNIYINNSVDSDYNTRGICRESVESENNVDFKNNFKNQKKCKASAEWAGYLENEDKKTQLKIPSRNTTNIQQTNSKVSLKWAKYLEEEEDLSSSGMSTMKTSTNRHLESEVGVGMKKIEYHEDGFQEGRDSDSSGVVTLNHFRSVSSVYCETMSSNDLIRSSNSELEQVSPNPLEKTSSDHFVSSSKTIKSSKPNLNWCLNSSVSSWRKKSCSSTDTNNFFFDSNNLKNPNKSRDDTLKNEFNKEVDNNAEKVPIQGENLISRTISSLPVFEQSGELSDSDFQLDF